MPHTGGIFVTDPLLLRRGRRKFLHELQPVTQANLAKDDAIGGVDILIAGHEILTRRCRLIFAWRDRRGWQRYQRRAPAPAALRQYCCRSIRSATPERGTACRRR